MSTLHQLPWQLWVAAGVILLPLAVVFGSIAVKLTWGLWPIALFAAIAGWGIWRLGLEWFWLAAAAIMLGLVAAWLWQRTRLFLAGDRWLEKVMMLGD